MKVDIKENTVRADNQMINATGDKSLFGNPLARNKILIIGNSITRHSPCAEIGWNNDWGMAASAEDKDYVHLLLSYLQKDKCDYYVKVSQLSEWERHFFEEDCLERIVKGCKEFNPDVIVFRLGENIERPVDKDSLYKNIKSLVNYINKNAKVVWTTCFWENTDIDGVIQTVAKERNEACIDLGCYGVTEYTAKGLFAHNGVASHPGDKGMKKIADLVYEELKPLVL